MPTALVAFIYQISAVSFSNVGHDYQINDVLSYLACQPMLDYGCFVKRNLATTSLFLIVIAIKIGNSWHF